MLQSRRRDQFLQRLERVVMEHAYAFGLVGHVEFLPTRWILGSDAGRAAIGVALARLDAAEREHEATRGIAPVRAKRKRTREIESGNDLAAGAQTHLVAQVQSNQRVVNEQQRLAQGRADVIGEFQRRRAGAALTTVDDDEIRKNP